MIYVAIYDSKIESAKKLESVLQRLYHHEMNLFICESIFALEHYVLDARKGNVDIIFASLPQTITDVIFKIGKMQEDYPNLQVTFLAEDEAQAVHIFQANPAYFIKKPFTERQLQEAMNRMLVRLQKVRREVLVFESAKGTLIIPQDEILYIESNRKEVTFVLTGERQEKGIGKLDDLENKLGDGFVRCHQSYIVNAGKIARIASKEIILYNQRTIPMSRPRSKEARRAIMEYLDVETV